MASRLVCYGITFQQTVADASTFDSFFLMFATASYHKSAGPFFSADIIIKYFQLFICLSAEEDDSEKR